MNGLLHLRITATLEGVSLLLLLLVAVPLEYVAGLPTVAHVVGSFHGLLFLLFVILLVRAALERSWPLSKVLTILVQSVVPLGALFLAASLRREERVDEANE